MLVAGMTGGLPRFLAILRRQEHSLLAWLAAVVGVFVFLLVINSFVFMPSTNDTPWRHLVLLFYRIFMLLCGLGAGVTGTIAVAREQERSWLVWLTILSGLLVLFLVLGELLFPH